MKSLGLTSGRITVETRENLFGLQADVPTRQPGFLGNNPRFQPDSLGDEYAEDLFLLGSIRLTKRRGARCLKSVHLSGYFPLQHSLKKRFLRILGGQLCIYKIMISLLFNPVTFPHPAFPAFFLKTGECSLS